MDFKETLTLFVPGVLDLLFSFPYIMTERNKNFHILINEPTRLQHLLAE